MGAGVPLVSGTLWPRTVAGVPDPSLTDLSEDITSSWDYWAFTRLYLSPLALLSLFFFSKDLTWQYRRGSFPMDQYVDRRCVGISDLQCLILGWLFEEDENDAGPHCNSPCYVHPTKIPPNGSRFREELSWILESLPRPQISLLQLIAKIKVLWNKFDMKLLWIDNNILIGTISAPSLIAW